MRKLISLFAIVWCAASFASAQNIRWDLGSPGGTGAATTSGSGLPAYLALPGVALAWCNHPANAAPCTNYANTYPSLSSTVPCPTGAQVVLQGGNTCQQTGDNFGNLGVYTAPPTSATSYAYDYTLTVNGTTYGPFTVTLASVSGTPNLLPLNNTWTGTNTFNGTVIANNSATFNGDLTLAGSLNGVTILGTVGGPGNQGYVQLATGNFTQNAIARFDASGDLVISFLTDSGAILAYSGVNGTYSPSYQTTGSGLGYIGWPQGTLPASCNGGVNTLMADTVTTLMVDCKATSGGTTYVPYFVESQPFFDDTGVSSSISATVLQTAAPAASEWTFKVNVNQSSVCTGTVGSVVVKVAYTDSGGLQTPTVATLAFVTGSTPLATAAGSWPLRVNSTNNISLQTTYTACTSSGPNYDLHAWLERAK